MTELLFITLALAWTWKVWVFALGWMFDAILRLTRKKTVTGPDMHEPWYDNYVDGGSE